MSMDGLPVTVAFRLAGGPPRRVVALWLAQQPLLPRWRLDVVNNCGDDRNVDILIVDDQHLKGAVGHGRDTSGLVLCTDDMARTRILPILLMGRCAVVATTDLAAELGPAIDAVLRGGAWIGPSALARISAQLVGGASAPLGLTRREREVHYLLLQGWSNPAIAAELRVELTTVKSHVRAILRKTGCASRKHLLARFHSMG